QPTPLSALVTLDGVPVGRGVWDGPVRSGKHRVEVAADGFRPIRRDIVLGANRRELAVIELERDPRSPMWQTAASSAVIAELRAGVAITPSLGGDLTAGGTAPCSKSLGLGGVAIAGSGYRFSSGLGLTLDAGYLLLRQELDKRTGVLRPYGLPPNAGTMDDSPLLSGLLAGASISLRKGSTWTFLGRLGGGVLLGSLRDSRTGTFTTNRSPTVYAVGPIDESARLSYAYVAPELHAGYRFGRHVELGV